MQLERILNLSPPLERFVFNCGLWVSTGQQFSDTSALAESIRLEPGDKSLIDTAFRKGMVPMVAEFSRVHQLDIDPDFDSMTKVIGIGNRALFKHVSPVLQALTDSVIDVMILKGGDLAMTTYPQHVPRLMVDIDIVVRPSDVAATRAIFRDHGFLQGEVDPDKQQIVPYDAEQLESQEANHYELAAFRKLLRLPSLDQYAADIERYVPVFHNIFVVRHEVFYVVKVDVHLNISRKLALDDMWYKPRQIRLPSGQSALAQSPADLVWFLATRVYYETLMTATARQLQFVDVLSVAKSFYGEIDWHRVQDMAGRYNLHASLFYVLSLVNEFIEGAVPPAVIEFCNPGRAGVPQHNNLGELAPALFRLKGSGH